MCVLWKLKSIWQISFKILTPKNSINSFKWQGKAQCLDILNLVLCNLRTLWNRKCKTYVKGLRKTSFASSWMLAANGVHYINMFCSTVLKWLSLCLGRKLWVRWDSLGIMTFQELLTNYSLLLFCTADGENHTRDAAFGNRHSCTQSETLSHHNTMCFYW